MPNVFSSVLQITLVNCYLDIVLIVVLNMYSTHTYRLYLIPTSCSRRAYILLLLPSNYTIVPLMILIYTQLISCLVPLYMLDEFVETKRNLFELTFHEYLIIYTTAFNDV